ncbi:hypothetical protein [Aneurinibacillus danicus]|uniref:Uncharacterized protein n=1 Tax=Aneurinibacillus danicus TaxID=267746 RepID=A0A511VCM4_9BACL|nr:hypothetical protein [Aneurinibacillus danicus]GEN36599.1 hypothetical protein ADA01nite_40590 [Aneurinibacillus danicus]
MNSVLQQFVIYGRIVQKKELSYTTSKKGDPVSSFSFLIQNETSVVPIQMRGHQFQYVFVQRDQQISRVPYNQWRDGKLLKGTLLNGRCFPDFEAVRIAERQLYVGMIVRLTGMIEVVGGKRLRYIAKEISSVAEIPTTTSSFSMTIQIERIYENRCSAYSPFAMTVEGKVMGQSQEAISMFYTCNEKTASLLTVGESFQVTGEIIRSPLYQQIEGVRFFSGIHSELRIIHAYPFSPVHA